VRAIAIALVACACGGTTRPSIAAADLQAEFETAECEYQARCGFFSDVATCQGAYTGFHFQVDASVLAEIDAKEVVYNGAAARACIDSYANATCDQTDAAGRITPATCDQIFSGTVGDGGPCVNGHECVSQNCFIPVCTVACCAGTCMGGEAPVRAKQGETCTSLPCVEGSYCDFTSSTCAPLFTAGTACTQSFQCAYGTGCIGSPKQCQSLPKLGDPCPDQQCRDDGLVCNASGVCARLGLPGDACTTDADCSHFYGCSPSHVCGVRDPGGACMSSSDCFEADTYCAIPNGQTAGTCQPPQANGALCGDDRECASDTCDDNGTPMTCIPEPACT
jgi:hypothetical protein